MAPEPIVVPAPVIEQGIEFREVPEPLRIELLARITVIEEERRQVELARLKVQWLQSDLRHWVDGATSGVIDMNDGSGWVLDPGDPGAQPARPMRFARPDPEQLAAARAAEASASEASASEEGIAEDSTGEDSTGEDAPSEDEPADWSDGGSYPNGLIGDPAERYTDGALPEGIIPEAESEAESAS